MTDYLYAKKVIRLEHQEICNIEKCKRCNEDVSHLWDEYTEINIVLCEHCDTLYLDKTK